MRDNDSVNAWRSTREGKPVVVKMWKHVAWGDLKKEGARVLAFLDWLQAERGNSPATRNQRLAVIKSLARYTAIERPEFLDQATQIIAVKQKKTPATDIGYLTGEEVKVLLAEPDPASKASGR